MQRRVRVFVGAWGLTLGLLAGMLLGTAPAGWAQDGDGGAAQPSSLWEKLQEPLSPWATAVFVWLVLFVVMAFIIGLAWLSRSRRY